MAVRLRLATTTLGGRMTFLLAILAMIAKDASVEFNMIAQVRGRAFLSACLSPVTTVAGIAVTVLGAGPVIQHGITGHALAVLAVILATDAVDGEVFTKLAQHMGTADHPARARHHKTVLQALKKS